MHPILQELAEAGLKQLLKTVPLPITVPEPLVRAEGPVTDTELRGRTAFVTRLRDDVDAAVAARLWAEGASLFVLDPIADRERLAPLERPGVPGATVRHAPVGLDDADALATAIAEHAAGGSHPLVLVHRYRPRRHETLEDAAAIEAALDELYAVGHAAARALPPSSRVLFVTEPHELPEDAVAETAGEALGAYVRSLAKELGRKGTTVNIVESAGAAPERVGATVAYLASARSAFVSASRWPLSPDDEPKEPAQPGRGQPRRLLEGKVALVTGGARGIGAAIAHTLALEGAAVALNDLPRSEPGAAEVLRRIRAAGGRAIFCPADVASREGAAELAAAIEREFGHLDVIVNNAGITRDRTIRKMTPERWREAVRVNLLSQLYVTEALEPQLRSGARVIGLSSVSGIAGNFGQTNYAAAKAGVVGWTRHLARRLGPKGIAVSAIAPGFIRTVLTARMPWIHREMAKQMTALAQPGEPQDIADVVRFLAGPDGAAVRGAVLRVDGAMAIGA
ncbi:MAG: SDR family oxidoreductase [Planctomycetota bacterium]|nr:MAG: SDR family oxidoreductase [Planctomycetota bacterium]